MELKDYQNGVLDKFNYYLNKLAECKTEPPRQYRRVFYLSQAAMPDRVKLS